MLVKSQTVIVKEKQRLTLVKGGERDLIRGLQWGRVTCSVSEVTSKEDKSDWGFKGRAEREQKGAMEKWK